MAGEHEADASRKILALLSAVLTGLMGGAAAVFVQMLYAPFGVFPLLIGMLTGGLTMAPLLLVSRRGFVLSVAAATLAAFGCNIAYHYGTFLVARYDAQVTARAEAEARRHVEEQLADEGVVVDEHTASPLTLRDFYRMQWHVGRPLGEKRVGGAVLAAWWVLDGFLIWLGAVMVTASFTTRTDGAAAARDSLSSTARSKETERGAPAPSDHGPPNRPGADA